MSAQVSRCLKRSEMEKSLHINDEMQRSLFEHAPEAIVVTDQNGLIFQVNAQAETMFGYRREELLGQSVDLLVPDSVRKFPAGHRTRPMGTAMNLTAHRKDGNEAPVEISLSSCTLDGELFVIAIVRDVSSDRKRAEETRRQQHTMEIQSSLYEIGQTIVNSTYLPTLLEEILDKTLEIGALDIGVIHLLDVESKTLNTPISRGYRNPENLRPISADPTNPIVGKAQAEVFANGGVYVAECVPTTDALLQFKKEGVASAIVVPVRAGDKIIGTIQLGSRTPRRFKPVDIRLFTAIGNQLGIAVQKSKLHGTTLQNLERMRALYEINKATTSTLDMRAILDILLEKIELCLPYAATTIRFVNREKGILEPVVCRNLDEAEWKAATGNIGNQINRLLPTDNAPVYTRHVQTDPVSLSPAFLKKNGLVSSLRVPLLVKGENLGVVSFYTREEHEFSKDEIGFLTNLAGQAAIAINNSQLYEDAQRREQQIQETLKQLQTLYAITTTANQTLNLDIVLNEAIQKVSEIFGFTTTRIFLFDRSMQTLLLKASYQSSPEPFATVNSFRRGQGIVGRAADANDPIIFEDIQNDPKYLEMSHMGNTRKTGFRFFASFPIKSKHQTLGAISFFGQKPRSLTANEIELLTAVAEQIGIAVEHARLFEETAQRADDLRLQTLNLERANKVKDEFLSIMSHELRTPLNVMMGYTGLLKDGMFGNISPEQNDALAKVLNQANDLSSTLNEVLRATQIGTGLIKAKKSKVNLGNFLDELKISYDVPMRKELTISWDYPSDLPDAETDSEKLKHILQNLINNAIKFTDKGRVRISARHLPQAKIVKFEVTDTGIGIPKESLPHIFDMFHQGDASDTRLHGGVGLGLYIVKKYTELLGGEIRVESESAIGSVFTVVIPSQTQTPAVELNLPILEESLNK